ncbi:hypothetical protein Glove_67g62 [Diversispora epigaea]|uniref:ATP-dependent DNA helicase n=1 Tax=Diversispora epigaea TaxID=1348612 RepID=A0A397JCK9_9GLOM|nr:hypothetical protein Glove_67g62 [Diversispora epigaea]
MNHFTMLEKLRIGNITEDIVTRIQQKIHRYNFTDKCLTETDKLFRHYTNLPTKVILKEGMRVMFLNNSSFTKGLFNGSIGVVSNIIDKDTIQVPFPLKTGIGSQRTSYFRVNGIPSYNHQFPLQNAFALTVHKTQGLM